MLYDTITIIVPEMRARNVPETVIYVFLARNVWAVSEK